MALRTQPKTSFPSHAVSDIEKAGEDYGLQVANAIEHEWFRKDSGSTKYYNSRQRYNNLRLYARGEQSVQKYKDELSINGDLSYLNLDWKPVPIIPKFVDIVVNGISERTYDLKAFSQDPSSKDKRTKYVEAIAKDMKNKDYYNAIQQNLGQNVFNSNISPDSLPQNDEELSLHMQLDYKQSIEIAEEEALNNVMALNDYDLIKKRLDYDITVLGLACIKNEFNTAEGIKIKYVDPVDIVFSYTDSPYFEDLYYVGEITKISMPELMKRFPSLTNEELKEIEEKSTGGETFSQVHREKGFVHILNFEYKTYKNQTYKIKQTSSGADKALQKDDTFNPPKDSRARFEKVDRAIEVLYCGAKIIGFDKLLDWGMAENMTRPKSDVTKCHMSYNIVAPRIYKGRPESLVGRMMSFADMIQLTHLKMQQVLSRMVPDGIYMDADGLAEIDLGNGTNYNPQEALNMYFQTGSVIGRSMTQDGDFNQGKAPIQEIQSGSGNAKLGSLINSYNYYLQMMRDVTGLNEARDGSAPDKNALVGVQKLAAANSNTATRHILQGGLFLTLKTAECISLRISDVLEYSNTKNQFVNSLGRFNVATLDEIKDLHLHDFGIFIELAPDEEEKQILENNIQMALQKELINLDDAIDIREIRNLKLANQLLKLRRRKKQELDRQTQMQNIQAQSQANAQAQQVAAQAEVQKNQAIQQQNIEAQGKSQQETAAAQAQAEQQKTQTKLEADMQLEEKRKSKKTKLFNNKIYKLSLKLTLKLNKLQHKLKFKRIKL